MASAKPTTLIGVLTGKLRLVNQNHCNCSMFSHNKDVLLPVISLALLTRCCEYICSMNNPNNRNLFILFSIQLDIFHLNDENQGSLMPAVIPNIELLCNFGTVSPILAVQDCGLLKHSSVSGCWVFSCKR